MEQETQDDEHNPDQAGPGENVRVQNL